jgi:hypothetical protein
MRTSLYILSPLYFSLFRGNKERDFCQNEGGKEKCVVRSGELGVKGASFPFPSLFFFDIYLLKI